MALNLELKIKIESQDNLIKTIEKNGGKFTHLLIQKDIYFKYSNGLLKLREQNGEFQLIKYNRNEKNGERWSDYSVSIFKGR